MDKDKLQELLDARAQQEQQRVQTEQELEKLRTPMTILFSDIKGSTQYAERKGDLEYMSMINRHNRLLFPVIEGEGGTVVKTIGDSILARFDDPVGAIKAAAGMQRALVRDREGREPIDQIRIRIGLHYGMGLIKDNDVFGDVVNAASRVEHQADAEQIFITDVLVEAARAAGFECAKIGRAELKGKDEPIDLYAVAWSEAATQQLVEDLQARYEKKLKEFQAKLDQQDEEFEHARDQWRTERRTLHTEIEELEESAERARVASRQQVSEDLQSELKFQIDELQRTREQLEHDLAFAQQKFEAERNNLKAQIAAMQASVVDSMARTNNPARAAVAIREQVDARVAEAKQHWQLEWEGERKRLVAEVERLKKAGSPAAAEEKKEAARRAVLERLGRLPAGSSGSLKTAEQWEREFEDAKINWETEREQLKLQVQKMEMELQRTQDSLRSEIYQEIRGQYEPKLLDANRERERLEQDIQSVTSELAMERQRLNARIKTLEEALPEAQEAARKQTLAELKSQFELKAEESNRLRSRLERKYQDVLEELESERRRSKKSVAALEEKVKEANEKAYKAMRSSGRPN
jgi:class 3 adenylate cyclase